MNTKRCSKCKQVKEADAFTKANTKPGGLRSRCKVCVKKHTKRYQTTEMTYTTRARYMEDWSQFFELEYGMDPSCQVCSSSLSYHRDDDLPTVVFDHRCGDETIKGSPSAFCRTHPCIEQHQVTWRSCDFGILCRKCNAALPTNGRQEWLDGVIRYMSGVQV
jgi:hypothetical protein